MVLHHGRGHFSCAFGKLFHSSVKSIISRWYDAWSGPWIPWHGFTTPPPPVSFSLKQVSWSDALLYEILCLWIRPFEISQMVVRLSRQERWIVTNNVHSYDNKPLVLLGRKGSVWLTCHRVGMWCYKVIMPHWFLLITNWTFTVCSSQISLDKWVGGGLWYWGGVSVNVPFMLVLGWPVTKTGSWQLMRWFYSHEELLSEHCWLEESHVWWKA